MKRLAFTMIICTFVAIALFGCQQIPIELDNQVVVTVEVTREVFVSDQLVATVAVPVEVTREVFVEVTAVSPEQESIVIAVEAQPEQAVVGSAENPIRLVFSPIYGLEVTQLRGKALVDVLSAETGLSYQLITPETHAATIDAVCSSVDSTLAFLTSFEYMLANQRCRLQSGYAGLREGIPWVGSMIIVRSPETTADRVDTLEDLAGKTWGVASTNDLTNYLYFKALLQSRGIETGAVTEYGTDASAIIAGFDRVEEFVTATFIPPLLPYNERLWEYGVDNPEIWNETPNSPRRSGIGYVVVYDYVERGGYRVRDARSIVIDSRSGVFEFTELVELSAQMPNDAVAFGAQMPLVINRQLSEALTRHTQSEACTTTLCSSDFFNWEGIASADNRFYDPVRFVIDELALSEEQVFEYLSR